MLEVLQKQIKEKGLEQVAKELGISKTTVYLVLQGKYKGSNKNIEGKIQKIYGSPNGVQCPILGDISPSQCAEIYSKAEFVGKYVSNPEKMRLYRECKRCKIRK